MRVYESITELVGNTPLLHLKKIEEKEELVAKLYGKLEFYNPGGSVKDRIALNMIESAEKDGRLKPGGTVIEGTSGNTGIGIAAVCAAKGYKAVICMPENMSKERISILKAYGAEVHLTPAEKSMGGSGEKAKEIIESTPNAFNPGQGGNPDNPGAHYKSTGAEIWRDTDGKIDILVACAGTGGTISGTAKYLKERNPNIKTVAVEPTGSALLNGGEHGPHKIQGIGGGSIPPVTDRTMIDEVIDVTDEQAYEYTRLAPKTEGILIGISAGAALYAATLVAKREENKGKTIVVIFPDGGDHYLSVEDLF